MMTIFESKKEGNMKNTILFLVSLFIYTGCLPQVKNNSAKTNLQTSQEISANEAEVSNSFAWCKTAPGIKMRYIGPGAGGSMFGMAFHPSNPNIIIFGGDMGACYRTEDGGRNWNIIAGKLGDNPRATWNVRFHPENAHIVWHLGSGVYKSNDAGKTWANMNAPNGTFGAIGLDPDNTNIAYIAEGQAPRSVLHWCVGIISKTTDGGKNWQKLSIPNGPSTRGSFRNIFTNFIIDRDSPVIEGEGHARVYLFGRGGVFRSEDAGKTWKDLSKPFGAGQINDMVLTKTNSQSILFLSVVPAQGLEKGGVYKSRDKGETWTAVNSGLESVIENLKKRNKSLKENPESNIAALLLAHSKSAPNRIYTGSRRGIYRSDNSGESWYQLIPSAGAAYIKDKNGDYMAIPKHDSHFATSLWGGIDNFNRFIADHSNADRIAFSDNQDMYVSENGGELWDSVSIDYGEAFDAELYPSTRTNRYTHKVISRGPQNLVCDQIKIDPFNPETYYASCMDVGFQVSRDGGKSWAHPTRGTPGRGHAWAVETDPAKEGRLYITIGQGDGQKGGIYMSEDGAHSWKRIGLDNATMGKLQTIAIDLKSPVDNRIIYIGSQKNGIYKTIDGGISWQNITPDFSEKTKDVRTIAISPKSSQIIYAGTEAGLLISTDSGKTWNRSGKDNFDRIKNISICKSAPSTMYISAHRPEQKFSWGKAGFWRSDDAGKTFTDITPPYFIYAGEVAVNPYNPDYIYGSNNLYEPDKNQKMRIVRSKDGGKTWENISENIATSRAVHLSIDQKDPRKLFVLTRFSIIEGRDNNAPTK